MRPVSVLALLLILSLWLIAPTNAAPAKLIPFSALLKSAHSDSIVPDGNYSVTFSIYTQATGGTALWSETQTVPVIRGVVSTDLGSTTPFPDTVNFDSSDWYLGVKVNSDPEMSPRKKIGTVPAAFNSDTVDGHHAGTDVNNVLALDSNGGFSIAGPIVTTSTLQGGDTTVAGVLNVTGANATGDALTVTGSSKLNGTLSVASAADIGGNLTIAGNLIPTNGGSFDLGTVSKPFNSAYINNLVVGTTSTSGTSNSSFTINQLTSGDADSALNFYRGGSLPSAQILWNSATSQFEVNQNVKVGGRVLLSDGTGSAPSLSFTNEPTSGLYRYTSGFYIFKVLGQDKLKIGTQRIEVGAPLQFGANPGAPALATSDGVALAISTNSTERVRVLGNGNVGIGITSPTAQLHVVNSNANQPGLIVQGAASQTADLFQVQNSAGATIASVDASQYLRVLNPNDQTEGIEVDSRGIRFSRPYASDWGGASLIAESGGNELHIGANNVQFQSHGLNNAAFGLLGNFLYSQNTSNVALVVRGVSGQAANLQEWQNSSGTVLAGINNAGVLFGGTTANSVLTLQGNTATTGNTLTNTAMLFNVGDSGATTAMTILNNGNVVIGASSTSTYKLNVAGSLFALSGRVTGSVQVDGTINSAVYQSAGAAGAYINSTGISAYNNGLIGFSSGSNSATARDTALSRLSAGEIALGNGLQGDYSGTLIASQIGISNSSPSYLLDVSGDINTTGKVRINGNQGLYIPDQTNFTGSLFVGDGGQNLSHTTGNDGRSNTGIGIGALFPNTTGYSNTAIGNNALRTNTTGYMNTAIGNSALLYNSTGFGNSALGFNSLFSNSSGVYNVGVGRSSLNYNTTGSYNTSLGGSALYYNKTGGNNAVVGYQAGFGAGNSSDISGNALFGYQAGYALLTGADYNTLIGYQAGNTLTTGANNILIGKGVNTVNATDSNKLNIGNIITGDLTTGNISIGGSITSGGVVNLKGYTVATLPSGTIGDTAYVTDATSPTFGSTVVGGGSTATPVFYNGTNWICY